MKDICIADPIIMALTNSLILKIFKPMNDPGIKIKKSTARAAPTESPKEPLSKNGVKNRINESKTQTLNLKRGNNTWIFLCIGTL